MKEFARRLMTDNQTGANWILTAHDVQVGPANGRQRHTDDGLSYSGARFLYLFNSDFIFAVKDCCPHCFHGRPPHSSRLRATSMPLIKWMFPVPPWLRSA